MSTADGGVTPIANLNGPLFCIAANKEGELFGIDGSGRLLNFDKSSGSYTLVGTTGFCLNTPSRQLSTKRQAFSIGLQ